MNSSSPYRNCFVIPPLCLYVFMSLCLTISIFSYRWIPSTQWTPMNSSSRFHNGFVAAWDTPFTSPGSQCLCGWPSFASTWPEPLPRCRCQREPKQKVTIELKYFLYTHVFLEPFKNIFCWTNFLIQQLLLKQVLLNKKLNEMKMTF